MARIFERPLDRSRPLWEAYLIHGLPDGHVAVLTKIHHAVIDGMSGAEIMGVLLDLSPEGREIDAAGADARRDRDPTDLEMLAARRARHPALPAPRGPLAAVARSRTCRTSRCSPRFPACTPSAGRPRRSRG